MDGVNVGVGISVVIDLRGFEAWRKQFGKKMQDFPWWLEKQIAEMTKEVMEQQTPKRTGRLASSIMIIPTDEGHVVMPTEPYAWSVEYGTGLFSRNPHLIFPKRAKALRFQIGAKIIFAKYTRGFPGRGYVRRTREIVAPRIVAVLEKLWRDFHGL